MDYLFKSIAWLLAMAYEVVGSYGFAIVILTLIVMAITTPFTIKGTKSMIKMQRLQPELKKIQERNKGDRQKMNEELLAFYKANGINPIGGCLPMLIQLPVFAVLYRVLNGLTQRVTNIGVQMGTTTGQVRDSLPLEAATAERRNFHPGYISQDSSLYESLTRTNEMKSWGIDLADSASSALSRSIGHALPYLVLIAIVAVTGVIQQRQIQGRSTGATINSQQQMIMKIMPFFLPIISFGLSAGLVVYFVVSNFWRVGQQAFITRTIYSKPIVTPVMPEVVEAEPAKTQTATAEKVAGRRSRETGDAAQPAPGRSVMGRASRPQSGNGSARPARPAKPKAPSPTASGRVTPAGASSSARSAKNKKKRK